MPDVSIIIPCFNAEQTICAALDSVLAQSCGNWEAIVVDDASRDQSCQVVGDYIQKHQNVTVRLHCQQQNGGVSKARNTGMELATGEYIAFLDADDLLDCRFVEKMLECATAESADFVVCNALRRVGGVDKDTIYPSSPRATKLEKYDCFGIKDYKFLAFFDTCWGKLYSREFLFRNNISFLHDMTFGEDTLFTNTALLRSAKTVVMGDYIGYVYTEGQVSASKVIDVDGRLRNLRCFIEEFSKQLPTEDRGPLCRKCLEYVWTIKRHGGAKRNALLKELLASSLWKELVFPVVTKYGKFRHRLVARLLDMGLQCAICQW